MLRLNINFGHRNMLYEPLRHSREASLLRTSDKLKAGCFSIEWLITIDLPGAGTRALQQRARRSPAVCNVLDPTLANPEGANEATSGLCVSTGD
jgi:hypothetical protein